jgi:hypothetical protein
LIFATIFSAFYMVVFLLVAFNWYFLIVSWPKFT